MFRFVYKAVDKAGKSLAQVVQLCALYPARLLKILRDLLVIRFLNTVFEQALNNFSPAGFYFPYLSGGCLFTLSPTTICTNTSKRIY